MYIECRRKLRRSVAHYKAALLDKKKVDIMKKLQNSDNISKTSWEIINAVRKTKPATLQSLKINGSETDNGLEMGNALNDYFTEHMEHTVNLNLQIN